MIQNLSLKQYHGELTDYIGSSTLKQMLISPKWFKYAQLHPEDGRISLENELKGSVYHSLLASITNKGDDSEFKTEYTVFVPPINEKTGKPYGYDSQKFMDSYNNFQYTNPDKVICSQSEVDLAYLMVEELRNGNQHLSKDINYLIKHGKAEQSHLVEYQGLKFKFRPDLETTKKIIDWKTCMFEVPKSENFAKQIVRLGYHISAAFYQYFDYIENGIWRNFYWVAQEKEPPYDFNIIDASNWSWEIYEGNFRNSAKTEGVDPQFIFENEDQIVIPGTGALIFLKILEEYIACHEKNEWPGYSVFTAPDWKQRRIATSPIPGWQKSNNVTFYNS